MAKEAPIETTQRDRALALRLGGAAALFLLLLSQAQITVVDGSSMLAVAQSIVHDGSLAVPPELGVEGDDGRFYSKYGLLLPLLSVVPVAVAQPFGELFGRVDQVEAAAAASLMPLAGGALVAWSFLLGRRLGAGHLPAAAVALGAVLGTYVLPYGRDFFTEPLVALGLVAAVERALAGRELHAGIALGFAVLARPQSVVFVALILAFIVLRGGGWRGAARTLPPLAVAAVLTIAYNLARFGDALEFGYKEPNDPGFTTPFFEGAGGLLFSPEKSIFLFAPVIVLVPFALAHLWRRDRWIGGLFGAVFVATFALAAKWHSWEGGWSWGPRLILPGVALALVALAPWIGANARRLRLAVALFAVGLVISLPAVLAPIGAQFIDRAPGTDGPQIVRQAEELPQLTERTAEAVSDPPGEDNDYRRYLAVWQAGIVVQIGWPGVPLALLGSLALVAALLRLGRPLARDLGASAPASAARASP